MRSWWQQQVDVGRADFRANTRPDIRPDTRSARAAAALAVRARRPTSLPIARRALIALLALLGLTAPLVLTWSAARAADAKAVADPPARVGRVALVLGRTDYYGEGQPDWSDASLNLPISSRSALATAQGSRAEVRIGANAVRLDGATQANFTQLDDAGIEIDVARGSVQAAVQSLPRSDRWALVVGPARLQLSRAGRYRVDVDPAVHAATVRVLDGTADLVLANEHVPLLAQQQASIDLRAGTVTVQELQSTTTFDEWTAARDRAPEPVAIRRRYVPASMTGAEALDEYGNWQTDSVYGPVWYPATVTAGWAPYRTGHWTWIAPWGWTWIDDAPWGFAPFHYGRWAFIGGRWGWVPGTYVARPVYAPALVAFFGGRDLRWATNAGAQGAAVGWFPLAPAEVWVPAYPASVGYVRNVNSTHVTNVATINNAIANTTTGSSTTVNAAGDAVGTSGREYRYAQTSFAATAVPQAAFVAGQPVAQAQVALTPAQLAAAPMPSTRLLPAAPAAAGGAPAPAPSQRFAPPPHAEGPTGAAIGLAADEGGQRRLPAGLVPRRAR